jgi:phosphoribosylformylglycinamidine cyclo-ligase
MPTKSQAPGGRRTYESAGVSIDAGDAFAASILSHMRRTYGQRVIANDGGFAGLFRLDYNESLFKKNFRDPVLVACADGVGTKIKLAGELGRLAPLGVDLVSMNVNDLVVQAAEPLFFLDYIACGRLEPSVLEGLVGSMADACAACGAALLGGETAEMPDLYAPGEIDLAGFAVGVVELRKAMDPLRVEAGDVVVGLESDGPHANGFSLVRAILEDARVDPLDAPRSLRGRTIADALLRPTRVYAGPIARLLRGYRVKRVVSGMAHITGGGIAGNLARALPDNLDARLDLGAWPRPPVFRLLQKAGGVEEREMRRVFNLGLGYCLIVRPAFAASVMRRLGRLGERPHAVGEIVPGSGEVTLSGKPPAS